jgi:hypothetical protein
MSEIADPTGVVHGRQLLTVQPALHRCHLVVLLEAHRQVQRLVNGDPGIVPLGKDIARIRVVVQP